MNDKIPTLFKDSCLPFQLEGQDIKGRVVRLNDTVHKVLNKHKYPENISRLLGQVMAFTALIGSMMKYDGILTTQMKGAGPLRVMVSDFATDGNDKPGIIRGYAGFADDTPDIKDISQLFGKDAYMAITMDQGKFMDRYQGIVSLTGEKFIEAAEEYFQSSEQLPTKIMLACDKNKDGKWHAAAVMIQHYARSSGQEFTRDEETTKDDWNTAEILLGSLKSQELLDDALPLQDILIRLFHQSGVRIFDHTNLKPGCRCSTDKLRTVLASLDMEELRDIAEDGIITATCEFCMRNRKFDIAKLMH